MTLLVHLKYDIIKKIFLNIRKYIFCFSSELLTAPAGRLHVVSRLSCFNDYFQVFDIQHEDVRLQASTINHSREAKPPFSPPFSHPMTVGGEGY